GHHGCGAVISRAPDAARLEVRLRGLITRPVGAGRLSAWRVTGTSGPPRPDAASINKTAAVQLRREQTWDHRRQKPRINTNFFIDIRVNSRMAC
ncbi:MAG TPA: hypothetical protein VGK87_05655, partial [Anaerolineae bacterium]